MLHLDDLHPPQKSLRRSTILPALGLAGYATALTFFVTNFALIQTLRAAPAPTQAAWESTDFSATENLPENFDKNFPKSENPNLENSPENSREVPADILTDFPRTLTPPGQRLKIPAIGLEAPVVIPSRLSGDFVGGDFDSELRQGVVKYPTTVNPHETGNLMIFGHTSQERRQKNPFGTVFARLPRLDAGQRIELTRNEKIYDYRIVETRIVRPHQVEAEFEKRNAKPGKFLTLMGCYPLGTTRQRILVIAEQIPAENRQK